MEIHHPSYGWRTVFDSSWTDTDSGVVCRQLGFTGGNKPRERLYYGEGAGAILLGNVECTGKENIYGIAIPVTAGNLEPLTMGMMQALTVTDI